MTIAVVSGSMMTKSGNGGEPWVRLTWVRGLQRLGFEVYFVEQIGEAGTGGSGNLATRVDLQAFRAIVDEFSLNGTAALLGGGGNESIGMTIPELRDLAAATDLLVNITGQLTVPWFRSSVGRSVYIDEDPGFAQIWDSQGLWGNRFHGHDLYFTVGHNIGLPCCPVPTGDIRWHTYRQPVILDDWPVSTDGNPDRFTTVGGWRGAYGSITYGDRTYGAKAHEFRKLIDLPRHVPQTFELAMEIQRGDDQDRQALREHGWNLVDPVTVAGSPTAFRRYIQESGGEFSTAQGIYVDMNTGWFSDRTVRYLASGKPVVVQDTGLARSLPVGEGLVPFRSPGEAIEGLHRIHDNYESHRHAARGIAEAYFDATKVLGAFIEDVGVAP